MGLIAELSSQVSNPSLKFETVKLQTHCHGRVMSPSVRLPGARSICYQKLSGIEAA